MATGKKKWSAEQRERFYRTLAEKKRVPEAPAESAVTHVPVVLDSTRKLSEIIAALEVLGYRLDIHIVPNHNGNPH